MNSKDVLRLMKEGKIKPEDARRELQKIMNRKKNSDNDSIEKNTHNEKLITPIESKRKTIGTNVNTTFNINTPFMLDSIAIIGMSGQFPKSNNIREFWDNISKSKDCITEIPESRWSIDEFYDPNPSTPNKTYCKWGGFIEHYDKFDSQFFNISPSEAELMDPQQRLILESCWHSMEDAGFSSEKLSSSRCGVFIGCTKGDYNQNVGINGLNAAGLTGGSAAILAGRISYLLNLRGPCMSIDTACSSSLVAVAEACNNLVLGNCDYAFAGGVSSLTGPDMYVMSSKAGMLSPDGKCFAFDSRANGFVPGEGVGAVLLKRYSDAVKDNDNIYAVIRGWGVNQDGKTNGITAPSAKSQAILENEVYSRFNINPETITLIESQGTGSSLGDPIEVEALTETFKSYTSNTNYCALGSVKSNIGHLFGASGITSFIKMVLSLHNKKLPPTINFSKLNNMISLDNSPFYINTQLKAWDTCENAPRRGAVSAFGFSGSNAHIVIDEYNNSEEKHNSNIIEDNNVLLVLSAKTKLSLKLYAQSIKEFLEKEDKLNLLDFAYTLMFGRDEMNHRLAITATSKNDLITKLDEFLNNNVSSQYVLSKFLEKKDMLDNIEALENIKNKIQDYSDITRELLNEVARVWIQGTSIDWNLLYKNVKPRRVSLPVYPFERKRYWIADTNKNKCVEKLNDDIKLYLDEDFNDYSENAIAYTLTNIVSKVLGIEKSDIDIKCELARYGLHSINSMSVIELIDKCYNVKLTSREIFENSSIKQLTQLLFAEKCLQTPSYTIEKSQNQVEAIDTSKSSDFTLSSAQKSLWVLNQWLPNNYAYNIPIAFKLKNIINVNALKSAFKKLVLRHPLLGSRIDMRNQELTCIMQSTNSFSFKAEQLSYLSENELHQYLIDISRKPFNLKNGPLLKVYLFAISDMEHILLISLHHIVFDGSSMPVLVNEIKHLYDAEINNYQVKLPKLRKTYEDFVHWQNNLLESQEGFRHKEYWHNKLEGELPVLNLPMKKNRNEYISFRGTTYSFDIPKEISKAIQELCFDRKVSPFVMMLSIFKALLYSYINQKDIIIGTVLQGRPTSEYSNLIGLFTNAVILRSSVTNDLCFKDLLLQVQDTVFEALEHGMYPFAEISNMKSKRKNTANIPLIQVMFLFQNWMSDTTQLSDSKEEISNNNSVLFELMPEVHQEGEFDITLEVLTSNSTYRLMFKYNDELFEKEFVEELCEKYIIAIKIILENVNSMLTDISNFESKYKKNEENTITDQKPKVKNKTKVKSVYRVRT